MPTAKGRETAAERRERIAREEEETARRIEQMQKESEEEERRAREYERVVFFDRHGTAVNALRATGVKPDAKIYSLYSIEQRAYLIPLNRNGIAAVTWGSLGAARQCGAVYDFKTACAIQSYLKDLDCIDCEPIKTVIRAVYIYGDGEEAPAEE